MEERMKLAAARELQKRMDKIANDAKANLDAKRTGALKDSIESDAKVYPFGAWGGVGINSKYQIFTPSGKRVKPAWYAHFIENGFKHFPDGDRVPSRPFLAPAVRSNGGGDGIWKAVEEVILEQMELELENAKPL